MLTLNAIFEEPVEIQGELDPLIQPLVEVLNRVKGVRTFESCEGHSTGDTAYVAFVVHGQGILELLLRAFNKVNSGQGDIFAGSFPFSTLELVWQESDLGGIFQWPSGCLPFCMNLHLLANKENFPTYAQQLEETLKELEIL